MMISALPLVCYLINLLVFSIFVCDAQRNYANTACCVRPNGTSNGIIPIQCSFNQPARLTERVDAVLPSGIVLMRLVE